MNDRNKLNIIRLIIVVLCASVSCSCQHPAAFATGQKEGRSSAKLKHAQTKLSINDKAETLELYSQPRTAQSQQLNDSLNEAAKNLRTQKDKEKTDRILKEVALSNEERGTALTTPRRMSTGVPHHPRYMDAKSPELVNPQPGQK